MSKFLIFFFCSFSLVAQSCQGPIRGVSPEANSLQTQAAEAFRAIDGFEKRINARLDLLEGRLRRLEGQVTALKIRPTIQSPSITAYLELKRKEEQVSSGRQGLAV